MTTTKSKSLYPGKSINLIHLTLLITSLKNIIVWRYFDVFDENYFRAPIFEIFLKIPHSLGIILLLLPLFCSPLLFFNNRLTSIPYILCSFSSIIALLTDFYGFHHDVLFASIIFLMVAYSYLKKDSSICFGPILGTTASIYLLTGISKISSSFIKGDVISEILSSPPFLGSSYFYPRFDLIFSSFLSQIAYLTIFVELLLCPILVILINKRTFFLRIILLIFHFALYYTGRGTVFNLLFPSILLVQIEYLNNFYSRLGYKQKIYKNNIFAFSIKVLYLMIFVYFIFLLVYAYKQKVFFN